jgi:hypothetical protein
MYHIPTYLPYDNSAKLYRCPTVTHPNVGAGGS